MSESPTQDTAIDTEEVQDGQQNSEEPAASTTGVRRHPTASKTPFDYPFVFPALLFVLACWFGWDGWFNSEMEDHRLFNRVLFGIFAVSCVWTLSVDYRVYKILKKRKESEEHLGSSESEADKSPDAIN